MPVRSAAEMQRAILPHAADADIIVMAAAVADYTPDRGRVSGKIEKATARWSCGWSGRRHSRRARVPRAARQIGPCSSALPPRAAIPSQRGREKLNRKKVDLIVANDISTEHGGLRVRQQRGDDHQRRWGRHASTRAEVADCRSNPGPGRAAPR